MKGQNLEEKLKEETVKWLNKIKKVEITFYKDELFLKNIKAYIKDSEYFLKKNDLINAFEAIVWAWAWLEIGQRINILKFKINEKN